jgi:protein KRI1
MEKAKEKYGQNYFFKEDSEMSESESEDSSADLLNDKVFEKFLDTMVKLQDNDKIKELVDLKNPIFEEDDFEEKKPKEKEKKAFTIKDALMKFDNNEDDEEINKNKNNNNNENEENDLYSVNYKQKNTKKIDKEKEEFINKAKEANEDDDDNDFIDDGFLKVKKTNENEEEFFSTKKENKKFNNLKINTNTNIDKDKKNENKDEDNLADIKNIQFDDILKKKQNMKNIEVLKKFWGEGQNLDPNEKFLRNYILSDAWKENDENFINKKTFMIDKEDEEKDQFFEEFEERYNFRYEEDGGANITTHKREMETFRIKDDTNKIKRKEREVRKEKEKNEFFNDLKIAKEAKKAEIKQKIDYLEKVAGTEKIKELADELEKEFDPENFDRIMNKIYNKDYYDIVNKEKEENEIEKIIEEKSFDYRSNKAIPEKEKLIEDDEDLYNDNELNNDNAFDKNDNEIDNENNEWFYCDECLKAIKENKIKYECDVCEDYTLCKSCFTSKNHQHQMKKSKVPFGCKV